MNTTAKGNRRQCQCRKELESQGWQCYTAHRGFMGAPIDILGLFDIIAYKDGYIRLIQVKSNVCPGEVREKIKAFKVDGVIVKTEIWVYEDYKGRTIEILSDRQMQPAGRELPQKVCGNGQKQEKGSSGE